MTGKKKLIKWDIEKVRHFVEIESKSDCILISDSYMRASDNLRFKCRCGEYFDRSFKQFKDRKRQGCENCQGRISWTVDKIKLYIEKECNGDCVLLSEGYKNGEELLLFRCECGEEFNRCFNNFREKKLFKCVDCLGHTFWDMDKVRRYVEIESGSGCKMLSREYINTDEKMKFQCKCGTPFMRRFTSFKDKQQFECMACAKERASNALRLTIEEVRYFVEKESNSDCKLISENYKNSNTILTYECSCGEIFTCNFNDFKSSQRYKCETCRGRVSWNYEKVKKYVEVESNSGCKLLSESYTNNHRLLTFECSCGEPFYRTFNSFQMQKSYRCRECESKLRSANASKKLSFELVKKFIEVESESGCILLSDVYINNRQDLTIKCECGEEFNRCFDSFKTQKSYSCQKCSNRARGERLIGSLLDSKGVRYTTQKSFEDCKDKGKLFFDFYIEGFLLIEYDGLQHFEPVDFAGRGIEWATEMFNRTKMSDCIKNQYCIENGIPLLRIPYWEYDNVDHILRSALTYFDIEDTEINYYEPAPLFSIDKFIVSEDWQALSLAREEVL